MKSIFPRIMTLFVLAALSAGATPRHAPSPRPRFVTGYRNQSVYEQLKRLRVKLELSELKKLDSCIMVDSGSTIGVTSYELLPFKPIVEHEFREFVSTNFCLVGDGEASRVMLKVIPLSYDTKRSATDDIECAMLFRVEFKDTRNAELLGKLNCETIVKYHEIEGIIPCSLYAAIQNVVAHCIDQLAGNADLRNRLEKLIKHHGPVIEAHAMEMSVGNGSYYYKQRATVACNDDFPDNVSAWAVEKIKEQWGNGRLFNDPCVFFSKSKFDKEEGVWEFYYDIIESGNFIVIPDATTWGRKGRCFIDCDSLRINDDKKAEAYMRKRLLQWFKDIDNPAGSVELKEFHQVEDSPRFRMAEYECK